jgi:hydroxyacylglutathione hydrolase
MEQAARTLFRSLQRFQEYPDWLQIWPGHGAGSACGKGLSAVPHSTVGYERRVNWAFRHHDEDAFVRAVLEGQPDPPKYFAEMKRINKEGPPILGGFRRPDRLTLPGLHALLGSALVVDTRHAADYLAAHIPGTINIPVNTSFITWAGWLLPFDRDISLIVDEQCTHCLDEAVRDLAMIGLDRVAGYFDSTVIGEWASAGHPIDSVPQITSDDLAERLHRSEVAVIDVRSRAEWAAGHIPDVPNIPLGHLTDRLDEIPRDTPVVVHCQTGSRSAIAASILRARGLTNVMNLTGGFEAWQKAGHPTERDSPEKLVAR